MNLLLFRHLWGVDEPWESVFPKIKDEGYHGIEAPLPNPEQRGRFKNLLKQFGFSFIPQIFTSGKTVDEHVGSFEKQVDEAQSFMPTLVNCHSGFDAWPEEESARFFETAIKIESARNGPSTFTRVWDTKKARRCRIRARRNIAGTWRRMNAGGRPSGRRKNNTV